MIALAIGYFVGGRWADSAWRCGLSLIIALSGLFTLMIPWATRTVLLATDPLGAFVGTIYAVSIVGAKTLERVFPHLSVFISEPGEDFNDFIFLAGRQPFDLDSKTLLPDQSVWLKNRIFPVNSSQGELLTDNLNPLEHLQIQKSEHYRHFIVDWLGGDLLVRFGVAEVIVVL